MRFAAGIVTGIVLVFVVVLGVISGPQALKVVSHAMHSKEAYVKAVVEGLEKCRKAETPADTQACVEWVRHEHQANLVSMMRQRQTVDMMLAEARGLTNWLDWARFRAFVLERELHLWVMADALKEAGTQGETLSTAILRERKA